MAWLGPEMQYPYTIDAFRADHPEISLRDDPPPEVMRAFGVFVAVEDERPDYNPESQHLEPTDWYPDGEKMRRGWVIVDD